MIQNVFFFFGPFVFEDYVKDVAYSLYSSSVSNIKLCVSRGV